MTLRYAMSGVPLVALKLRAMTAHQKIGDPKETADGPSDKTSRRWPAGAERYAGTPNLDPDFLEHLRQDAQGEQLELPWD
jgi:hypothetical protein